MPAVNDTTPKGALCYLASPYSKYPAELGGIYGAFKDAAEIAAKLLKLGISVYSPIAHSHPIAVYGDIDPYLHDIWMPHNKVMMQACRILIVAEMEGWRESEGITEEIKWFDERGLPIYHLHPQTVVMVRREMVAGLEAQA